MYILRLNHRDQDEIYISYLVRPNMVELEALRNYFHHIPLDQPFGVLLILINDAIDPGMGSTCEGRRRAKAKKESTA